LSARNRLCYKKNLLAIKREIEAVRERCEDEKAIFSTRASSFTSRPTAMRSPSGNTASKPMENAHRSVFGRPVPYAKPIRYGITSDGSRIAAYGVPSVTYGPGFGIHLVDPTETRAPAEWDTPTGRAARRGD
jgi:acetylornithine deacetylase/succinyl-diaminopimelate desuccinylase-like protein